MSDNSIIDLYTSTDPGASHGDISKLHHIIIVEEIPATSLIGGSPDFASDLWHDLYTDIVIFKQHHLPFFIFSFNRKAVITIVGIDLFGRWDRIRIKKWIGQVGFMKF